MATRSFRIDTGIPAQETVFRLLLEDFATEELSPGQAEVDQEIIITSEQHCGFLSDTTSRLHRSNGHSLSQASVREYHAAPQDGHSALPTDRRLRIISESRPAFAH
ncbi:hypothetical protein E8E15_000577 [Penicillium rubens]|nr:hypothetical protein E8E15_000577 [Penicillium rubens]